MPRGAPRINRVGVEKLLEEIQAKRSSKYKQQYRIAVVGRTGTGKSSLINSLIGGKLAPVGDYEPVTSKIETYDSRIGKVQLSIIDTPGIGEDDREDKYLDLIHSKVEEFDSVLFVSRLPDRVSGDEKRAVKIISEKLGSKIWERSLIVFTFSDYIEPSQHAIALQKRTELLHQLIAGYANAEIANNIPSVAVANRSETVIFFASHGFTETDRLIEEAQEPLVNNSSSWLELLSAEDAQVRAKAALELGKIGDENAVPSLCGVLATDRNPEVRRSAAEALGMIGGRETELEGK